MSKSKEIAELLNAEITRTVHLDVMHHEAAAHILAQEADLKDCNDILRKIETSLSDVGYSGDYSVGVEVLKRERDQASAEIERLKKQEIERLLRIEAKVDELVAERDQARDALRVAVEALDGAHGFLEFLWREVSMNDWASTQRDLLEKDVVAAIKQAKEALK